jgi:hypothetical protein
MTSREKLQMTSLTEQRRATGQRAEAAATRDLQAEGFTVTNLNDLVGNCPFADLIARKDGTRILVQVKGTETVDGKFGTPPARVRSLEAISTELGCHAIYAFVHLADGDPVVRFAAAGEVAELADEAEADYPGTNRYHVDISQFDITADRITELLE